MDKAKSQQPELNPTESVSYIEGKKTRESVLGAEHVNRSLSTASPFLLSAQVLATEHGWDAIWNRPGLSHRERSIITLSILTALGKQTELAAHVRGAVNNGLKEDEIKEILLQCMVYAGLPTGLEAFRTADGVLRKIEQETAAQGPA